jgi:serine/threonine-protein kinase
VGGPQGASDLWVAELERGAVSRLSQGEPVSNPVWTPDGSRIAYQIRASGADGRRHRIAWRVADGSRDAEILLESDREVKPSGFTPDGSRLLFTGQKKDGRRWEVSFLPMAGAREPELLLTGDFSNRDAVISPDGRLIAYASNESGVPTVFVRPFPSGEGRWQVSPGVGIEPRWGPDQKELYYRSATDILRVPIESRAGFSAGRPEVAVDRVSLPAGINSYSIAAGGRIFAARTPDAFGGRRTLHLDLDFARRLAGAGSPARR